MKGDEVSKRIRSEALELGFSDAGISEAVRLDEQEEFMEEWLGEGFQGEMSYLERNKSKRYDPRLLVPGSKSIITVLYNYHTTESTNNSSYRISKYAYGKDYHFVIKDKLKLLAEKIQGFTNPFDYRVFVDSAPMLDRAWAQRAGLGFIGKNTCLIHPRKGSYFFIGHLLTSLELQYNTTRVSDYCGTCRRCLDACPTGALVDVHKLDARKCISYLTIEYKGVSLPDTLKDKFQGYIFGCDICQDVCPWNRFSSEHKEPLFRLLEEVKQLNDKDWEHMDSHTFGRLFRSSALKRAKHKGVKRNIDYLKD